MEQNDQGGRRISNSSKELVAKFVHGKIKEPDVKSIDGDMINGEFIRSHGIHWITAAFIMIGDIAGGSMIALPTAIQQSGAYFGIVVCALVAIISTLAAIALSDCWCILLRHWPEFHQFTRKPYAEIGGHALGEWAKRLSSVSVNLSQFGIAVVLILLASKNIHDVLRTYFSSIHLCLWIIIISIMIFPATLLKSPEDFWFLIVASGMATFFAVILIIIGSSIDYGECSKEIAHAEFSVINLFVGFGTIVFAWGGHSTFPTIHHDCKRPKDFKKSILLAFSAASTFYVIVILMGFITYGNSLRNSIINSLQTLWIQQSVNALVSIHCILSTLIMINPLNLEVEEFFGIPQTFGIQRVLVRGSTMAAVILVATTFPNFGPVINLIGASTFTLTCIILPNLFYLYLKARENKLLETRKDEGPVHFREVIKRNTKLTLFFCSLVIVGGICAGSIATATAIREISSTRFEVPCYLKPFRHEFSDPVITSTNCCGRYQNITSDKGKNTVEFCNTPDFNFYK